MADSGQAGHIRHDFSRITKRIDNKKDFDNFPQKRGRLDI